MDIQVPPDHKDSQDSANALVKDHQRGVMLRAVLDAKVVRTRYSVHNLGLVFDVVPLAAGWPLILCLFVSWV